MKNILHIRQKHAAYMGDFGFAMQHHHAAPVLLLGLSGPIRVKIGSDAELSCRSALIDANVDHSVDCMGEYVASLYCEVDSFQALALRQAFLRHHPAVFDITKTTYRFSSSKTHILNANLHELIKYKLEHHESVIDPRVLSCLDYLKASAHSSETQSQIAQGVSLSRSRLNHLFKGQTGVSYRRFKLWSQVVHFMRDFHTTKNLTASALNSGFSDASHLSNSYRKVFGLSPSSIFANLDDFEVRPF